MYKILDNLDWIFTRLYTDKDTSAAKQGKHHDVTSESQPARERFMNLMYKYKGVTMPEFIKCILIRFSLYLRVLVRRFEVVKFNKLSEKIRT